MLLSQFCSDFRYAPMALSYFSNCLVNPEMSSFQQAEESDQLAGDYLSGFDSSLLFFDTAFIDPFLQPQPLADELLCSDAYAYASTNTNLLPFSPPDEYTTYNLPPEPQHFEYLEGRNNIGQNCYRSKTNLEANNELFFAAGCNVVPNSLPRIGTCDERMIDGKQTSSSADATVSNLSSQSIAARRRRRKISSKTQELGKLIPGAHKMNTAQMLQAAYKYVKFLQAQVSLLQTMFSIQQGREETLMHSQELPILLASQAIQEKLYSEEKCLVPEHIFQALGNDNQILNQML